MRKLRKGAMWDERYGKGVYKIYIPYIISRISFSIIKVLCSPMFIRERGWMGCKKWANETP
jgi:hypothetical protein